MATKMQITSGAAIPKFDAITVLQSKYGNKETPSLPFAAANFDLMPDTGYVRAPVVLALFGISRATLWRWVRLSRIPSPKTIGRSSFFQVGQLRVCLENLQSSGQADAIGGSK